MELSSGVTAAPAARRAALLLGTFLLALFALTSSKLRFGYEGANLDQAGALLRHTLTPRPESGGILPYTQGGVLEVAAYLPFTALRLALEQRGLVIGFQQLIEPLAIPFYTTILCLLFFGLAHELYRRVTTATALTLALALATMIWPYAKFGMETQQTFWTLAAVWAIVRYDRALEDGTPRAGRRNAALALGVALGALMLTKITGPLHALVLGLAAIWIARRWTGGRFGPRLAGDAVCALAPALAGVALFLATNRWRYGGWVWAGRYGMNFESQPYPLWDALWAIVASPGKSIFLFNLPLLAACWFWGAFWRRFPAMRAVTIGLLAIGVLNLHMRPWADETWGPRRLHFLVPLLLLPLGIAWERRREMAAGPRWLIRGALLAGLAVQLLAIAFDYSALALSVGKTELFSQEHTVWDPQLCPLRFNLHLLHSMVHRARGEGSLPFVYQAHYLSWSAPNPIPPPLSFDVSRYDRLAFWPLEQARDWSPKRYWFVSPSSYLALGLAMIALLAALGLRRLLRA